MARMDVADAAKGAEAFVGLALAEYVDEQHRAGAAERARRAKTHDAATWATETAFGRAASGMLGWTVTPPERVPAQVAEATVTLYHGPYPVTLAFRAVQDDDPSFMADAGAFFVDRDCYTCGTAHVTRVTTLAELGTVLTAHDSGDMDKPHGAPPALPKEWTEPTDPRTETA